MRRFDPQVAGQRPSQQPQPVECTNCSPDGLVAWLPALIGLVALAMTGVAFYMQGRQHVEFLRQAEARADFEVIPRVVDGDGLNLLGSSSPVWRGCSYTHGGCDDVV
jgi:hypothetical protein